MTKPRSSRPNSRERVANDLLRIYGVGGITLISAAVAELSDDDYEELLHTIRFQEFDRHSDPDGLHASGKASLAGIGHFTWDIYAISNHLFSWSNGLYAIARGTPDIRVLSIRREDDPLF